MMGISIWQLLIILAIVLVLFGAKRLRTLGTDLGSAIKGFKSAMREGEDAGEADARKAAGQLEGEASDDDEHFREEKRAADERDRS